jgi:hypothetical protein
MHTLLEALPDPMCLESTIPPLIAQAAPAIQCVQLTQSTTKAARHSPGWSMGLGQQNLVTASRPVA